MITKPGHDSRYPRSEYVMMQDILLVAVIRAAGDADRLRAANDLSPARELIGQQHCRG